MYTYRNGYSRKTAKPHVKHEETLQNQVCQYLRRQYPAAIFRSDYASGLHMTPYQALKHQKLQSGRSFPDLFIYEGRNGYKGLAIELKREGATVYLKNGARKGKLSTNPHIQEQAAMLQALNERGYYATFAVGYESAISIIDEYFGTKNTELF